jgi:hypothetical protein
MATPGLLANAECLLLGLMAKDALPSILERYSANNRLFSSSIKSAFEQK